MKLNVPLGQDESVIKEYSFSESVQFFFLKSDFLLTEKRVIVNYHNYSLFVIPTGSNKLTFPLRNISGVGIRTKFKFMSLFLGVVLLLIGFSQGLSAWYLTLLGVTFMINAFKTVIEIGSAGGAGAIFPFVPWERGKAQIMIDELNQVIADQ